jgi:hypothetical protein
VLPLTRGNDPLSDLRGHLAGALAGYFAELHRRHFDMFDMEVNAVKQGSRDAAKVILNLAG